MKLPYKKVRMYRVVDHKIPKKIVLTCSNFGRWKWLSYLSLLIILIVKLVLIQRISKLWIDKFKNWSTMLKNICGM